MSKCHIIGNPMSRLIFFGCTLDSNQRTRLSDSDNLWQLCGLGGIQYFWKAGSCV